MGSRPKPWFANRSTGDLLVLLIAATICFAVIATGALLGILAIIQPDRYVAQAFSTLAGVINTLVGLMAGFLAGRSGRRTKSSSTLGDDEGETPSSDASPSD